MSQPDPKHPQPSNCEGNLEGIAYKDLSPDQREMTDILHQMETYDFDLLGIAELGRDGVFRFLDADRNIHYAIGLRPGLIKALLDRTPYNAEEEKLYRGVDGSKVPKEQWYNPPPGTLPPPLSEEHRKEGREQIEQLKDRMDDIRKESENYKERLVYVESDHKLE